MSNTETSRGLPVVSGDTVQSIFENYTSQEPWGIYLEEVKNRLIKENPELVKFIESQVGRFPTNMHTPVFEVVLGTIALLEHQAQSNRMSSSLLNE